MYLEQVEKDPSMSIRQIRKIISDAMGIGESTINITINEYNKTKQVTSPKKNRVRKSYRNIYDEFSRNVIRRHVHSIWFQREIPTVDKIHQVVSNDESLPLISRTNLFHLLKELDFRYNKRGKNSALTEKNEIVVWRRRYLESIRKYREEGRHLYYLDETWVNTGDNTNNDTPITTQRNTFLIVLHIGSKDGFVPGGLLCFESKKNSRDKHDEMNGEIFRKWMENILPQLKENSVIIMDNAFYHSVKIDEAPTSTTRKADIIKWLENKGEIIDKPMVIPQLLEMVKRLKPLYEKYVIDELVKASNRIVLRIPPYHCELNPIEQAWESVKIYVRMNNTIYTFPEVKRLIIEGVERVNAEMWKTFINNTKKEEKMLWEVDFIIDEVLAAEMVNFTMMITRDTSSDSDFD